MLQYSSRVTAELAIHENQTRENIGTDNLMMSRNPTRVVI